MIVLFCFSALALIKQYAPLLENIPNIKSEIHIINAVVDVMMKKLGNLPNGE